MLSITILKEKAKKLIYQIIFNITHMATKNIFQKTIMFTWP